MTTEIIESETQKRNKKLHVPNMSVCVLGFVLVFDCCFWVCWNLVWRTFNVVKSDF